MRIRIRMDPHLFVKLEPWRVRIRILMRGRIRIRICIKVNGRIRIRIIVKVRIWIWIRIKVKSRIRIRIRIKVKSRIRIRIWIRMWCGSATLISTVLLLGPLLWKGPQAFFFKPERVRIYTQIRDIIIVENICPSFGFKRTFAATIITFCLKMVFLWSSCTFWRFFWSLILLGTQTIF